MEFENVHAALARARANADNDKYQCGVTIAEVQSMLDEINNLREAMNERREENGWVRVRTAKYKLVEEYAERYRWIRDPCSGAERVLFNDRGDYRQGLKWGDMLDEAIDHAMLETA